MEGWNTAELTLDLKESSSGPTPAHDMAPQLNTESGHFPLGLGHLNSVPLLSFSRLQDFYFNDKRGPWSTEQLSSLISL